MSFSVLSSLFQAGEKSHSSSQMPQKFWPDKPAKTDQIRKKAFPNSWQQINHYFLGTDYGSYRNSSYVGNWHKSNYHMAMVLTVTVVGQKPSLEIVAGPFWTFGSWLKWCKWKSNWPRSGDPQHLPLMISYSPAIFTCHMTVFLLGIYDMTGLGC